MRVLHFFPLLAFSSLAHAWQGVSLPPKTGGQPHNHKHGIVTRTNFLETAAALSVGSIVFSPFEVSARGRATLDQSYDRYAPRILAGGEYFKSDLRNLVTKNDWAGIKLALQEPPKKTKEDRSKPDGGTSERAAQAGAFSDARVLVACDLYAGCFSDSSVSPKTKKMKAAVESLRRIVGDMNSLARQGLGEEVGGGGLFGMGAKKTSKEELSKNMKQLYVEGGTAWNQYIFEANEGLPIQLKKLPYL